MNELNRTLLVRLLDPIYRNVVFAKTSANQPNVEGHNVVLAQKFVKNAPSLVPSAGARQDKSEMGLVFSNDGYIRIAVRNSLAASSNSPPSMKTNPCMKWR
jgi:hypothetical protein